MLLSMAAVRHGRPRSSSVAAAATHSTFAHQPVRVRPFSSYSHSGRCQCLFISSFKTASIPTVKTRSGFTGSRLVSLKQHRAEVTHTPPSILAGLPAGVVGLNVLYQQHKHRQFLSYCEQQQHQQHQRIITETGLVVPPVQHGVAWMDATVVQKIQRVWRLVKRLVKLTLTLTPVATFYPLYLLLNSSSIRDRHKSTAQRNQDAHAMVLRYGEDDDQQQQQQQTLLNGFLNWYLRLCLRCVEHSGAAVIKLMQWSSSRPDLFGHAFCHVFAKLQDDTTPHHWRHTCRLMEEAYGENWRERIHLDANEILGSGCIGQVYKGRVKQGIKEQGVRDQLVAVKVLHPAVQDDIDADLDLLRVAVRIAPFLPGTTSLKWLNLEGVVEEFAHLLKLQIDLRREADNLRRFNHNFRHDKVVKFPQLVEGFEPTENILVETFCEGVPVVEFCRQHRHEPELLRKMCNHAIQAVCQMIFLDNYVHGDLHPGNGVCCCC